MKNLSALITFLLFAELIVTAQNNYEGGNAMHGVATNAFAFKMDAPVAPVNQPLPAYSPVFDYESTPQHSYVGIFEIGGLFGISAKATDNSSFSSTGRIHYNYTQKFFSMQTIQGRQLQNRKVFMGFGFGFDMSTVPQLSNINGNAATKDFLVPLFMDIRGYFLKGRISPFIEGKFGGSFCVPAPVSALNGYQIDGGALLGLNLGVRAFITHKLAANLGFGYRMQNLITTLNYPTFNQFGIQDGTTAKTEIFFLHFLNLMAGISF